jgi:hypothetical protein
MPAEWVTIDKAATEIGYNKRYIQTLVRRKAVRGRRVGPRVWVDLISLRGYSSQQTGKQRVGDWFRQDTDRLKLPLRHVRSSLKRIGIRVSDNTILHARKVVAGNTRRTKRQEVIEFLVNHPKTIDLPQRELRIKLELEGIEAGFKTIREARQVARKHPEFIPQSSK